MSDLLAEILILFFEVLCSKIFYETFGKVRKKSGINIVQLILLESGVLVAARAFSNVYIFKQIIAASIYALFMFWHIKISIRKSFILALLYQSILLSTDYLAHAISSELRFGSAVQGKQYNLESVLAVLFAKALVAFWVLVVKKQLGDKPTEILSDTDWLKLMIFPLFTIVIITPMLSFFKYVETSEQTMLLFISAFGIIGMNIVVFYFINDIVERETQLYESRIFQLQAKSQTEKYQAISENFDRQKKRIHEYKNQIECMESLLEKKQYIKLEEYIKGICGNLDKELDAIDTNNVIVNAVLNAKYQEAEANRIVFVLRVNDLSKLRVDDKDIVTILSNLLNNAIEACKKCDIGRRMLKLKFVYEDGLIKIGVKNTYSNPILYDNGEIKSTKMAQTEEHGVGIKNIIEIIEKYNGSYVIKNNDKEFYFSIIISD